MLCLHCGKETKNPKFCSRSCSAIVNNKKFQKRAAVERRPCRYCLREVKYPKVYCGHHCQRSHATETTISKWESGEDVGYNKGKELYLKRAIRTYMMKSSDYKCSICGWGKTNPVTGKIPLQIHHIDGDVSNCAKTNLQVLCPNCHSLTENFMSLNQGAPGRRHRRKNVGR